MRNKIKHFIYYYKLYFILKGVLGLNIRKRFKTTLYYYNIRIIKIDFFNNIVVFATIKDNELNLSNNKITKKIKHTSIELLANELWANYMLSGLLNEVDKKTIRAIFKDTSYLFKIFKIKL